MHAATLSKSIDAADALLQARRRPRQLEVHDKAASMMEIEPFACGVGRQEHNRLARRESAEDIVAFACAEPAMELERCNGGELSGRMVKRVAVLGEDKDRLRPPGGPSGARRG